MYKVSVIGYHAKQKPLHDGQTVKTQQLTKALQDCYGQDQINEVDMQGCTKQPFSFLWSYFKACRNSENVIILPAYGALKVFPFLCLLFRKKGTKLFYDVIGGWLGNFIKSRTLLRSVLKRFDGIWVETSCMRNGLAVQGFENIAIVPNFKELSILSPKDLHESAIPIHLCIFSRITEVKGIEDGIRAIQEVNGKNQKTIYTLDMYGPIDKSFEERFKTLKETFPDNIRYCGCVEANKSTETLKKYDALLFPTRYIGEGHPGTVIDAYSSGLPVISAKWHSYSDFVDEGETGFGYEQFNREKLIELLEKIAETPNVLNQMRENCLNKASLYSAKTVIQTIDKLLNG
ncbi:MAG: glycosyltransferase [Paludibacteraceae bacterium]|nr:glycosyltransferase [Paludibacteraceae bacterium]